MSNEGPKVWTDSQTMDHRPWESIMTAGSKRPAGFEATDVVVGVNRGFKGFQVFPSLGCFGKFTPCLLNYVDGCFRCIWAF